MQPLARTMAYKYGFLGFPLGGAKAAIQILPHQADHKPELLFAFGKALSPVIRSGAYLPGIDMNCSVSDVKRIFQGAGIPVRSSGRENRSHEYTAWSCYISTLVGLEVLGHTPENTTFALQGFGQVSSAYAKLMANAGAKLIAISNRSGAIVREKGFDVDDLIKARNQMGDEFINQYPQGDRITHDQIFTTPVTVLLPAARAWAIHKENFQDIQASVIICAANVPMDDEIEQRLFERGKIVVTDFVANCGGMFGSLLEYTTGIDSDGIWNLLNTVYRKKVSQLVFHSRDTATPIASIAKNEAQTRISTWAQYPRKRSEKLKLWMLKKAPKSIRTKLVLRFFEKLWDTENSN